MTIFSSKQLTENDMFLSVSANCLANLFISDRDKIVYIINKMQWFTLQQLQ